MDIDYNSITMKKILFLLIAIQFSCNPKDCFKSTGKIIEQEVTLSNFNEIYAGNEISVILKQGATQKVIIKTGENLIDNINVEVIDNELRLSDDNDCNFTRDYAVTKILITSPNITKIRSSTARIIQSDGVLNYPQITLISEDNTQTNALNIGDFDLKITANRINIVANGNSVFKLEGTANRLIVGFYSGSSRFEGENLLANEVQIIQKSTNDILTYPLDKITGEIFSIGNVISFNHPLLVDVQEHYSGQLIFN